jgi:4-hydroxyphenylacetate 3-monooxygenase oxygenase component
MDLDITTAQGALTGARYLASLKDDRVVWLNGERVDVTTHPAFGGMLRELTRLYDLQHTAEYRDRMTYVSPETGNRVSYSYLRPSTLDELLAKRRNCEIWMAETWGQLPRAPDFMANVAVGLYDFRKHLRGNNPRFGENAVRYHAYCQEHDLVLTHGLGDPQIDRSSGPTQDPDMALRVLHETPDGIVIRGAKQLATLAPLAHEILVYLSASFALREQQQFVLWFALPVATPGITILCREPLSMHASGHSHPFAARYDEQDAMAFFDDVFVPWERVFLLYDGPLALRGLGRINAWSLYSSQIRFHHRLQTFIGVATLLAESIGVDGFREIREKLGELISYAEMVRLGLRGMEADARLTDGGLLAPGESAAMSIFAAQVSPRLLEIVREIGASGLIMQPSEADLAHPELRPYLDRYMRGHNIGAAEKARLFRLAWDLAGDSSGSRQELYERWHRGDIVRNRMNLYLRYDRSRIVERIRQMISQPLP